MGAQLMADSSSQVIPIYVNISRVLSGDATPYFQPTGFLKKYGAGTIYGEVLTVVNVPSPPPSMIPPQNAVVSSSQAPPKVTKAGPNSPAATSGSSVGLLAAMAVLGCIVVSACVAIFVMLRRRRDNRIHVEIGESPIYVARREISEGGTAGGAEVNVGAPTAYPRNPLPPPRPGPRNQGSIYFPGSSQGYSLRPGGDHPRLRSSAGGKTSSNGGRSSSGGGRKDVTQTENPRDNSNRWI